MKVKLINVADYEIKEDKVTDIPFKTFVNLCGNVGNEGEDENEVPSVRLFKTMDDFKKLSASEMEEVNQEESIKVLSNGQFLVFLKDKNPVNKEENNRAVKNDATTDTEAHKGE